MDGRLSNVQKGCNNKDCFRRTLSYKVICSLVRVYLIGIWDILVTGNFQGICGEITRDFFFVIVSSTMERKEIETEHKGSRASIIIFNSCLSNEIEKQIRIDSFLYFALLFLLSLSSKDVKTSG